MVPYAKNAKKHDNCSHEFYPHWEGDPIPEFKEPKPRIIDGKEYTYYEATQEQRRMERKARTLKREIEAQRAAGNKEKLSELNRKLAQNNKDYRAFSKAAGLRPKTERMQIAKKDAPIKEKSINSPINNRGKSYGKVGEIEFFGGKPSKRQINLDSIIKEKDKFYEFNKRDISLNDLAALTSMNGVEYAMFTKSNKRIVMRGDAVSVAIYPEDAEVLAQEGYKWSGHTHPGRTHDTMDRSPGDVDVLMPFIKHKRQKQTVIYNSAGNWQVFNE